MKHYFTTLFIMLVFAGNAISQAFIHPGGLHTQEDLDRMKAKVAAGESPWIEGWNGLIADGKSSATYGISGGVLANANQRQNMNRDAQAAYLNALRWYISGDVAHAEKAISIYNAYARTVNQIPSGGNTDILGLGGIGFTAMAVGAEIMRLYEGWAPADFEKFKFMMKEYFYPVTHDFLTNHRGACPTYYWANWDLNNISAQIAIGILVDDRDIYNEGVEYFKNGIGNGSISNAVPFVQGNFGQWQESGRDQSHGFLGIGLMANICQLAWNQGDDLYGYDDNRFLKGAEYVARTGALSLKAPFFEEYNSCNNRRHRWVAINALGRYFDQPVWEIVYNHYVVKQGLEAPHVKAMAKIMRLSRSTNDQLGHGTLTHTLDSDQSPLAFAAPPGQLDGLAANAGIGRVQLRWNALESMDAKGYTIKRSTTPGGPYVEISRGSGSTFPGYTDSNVENGKTYYYVVSANNPAGDGPDSEEIAATPKEEGEALPVGWTRADIGNMSIKGKAGYALVNTGHTFITSGAGIIGGTSDAIGFTYGVASGDVTLTARIVEFGGLQKTGIMIRESLDPNAKTVLMKIGDAGWRIAEMGARNGTGANMEWIGGNRYTWAPEIWFRISRSGNTFTVYESNNKEVWFEVGSRTIEMGTDVYVGLFNSSGNTTSLNTTRYDHVSITGMNGNAPAAPANLTASTGNTLITLNWDEVVSASSYTLKRATTSGGPYQVVATNLSSTQYTDTGLENGTTYYYVVTAANLAGEGQNSNEAGIAPVLTLAPVPGGVVAASVSGNRIDLSWEASLSATSYNIKRSETDGGPYATIASPTTTMFSDTGLIASKTYYYVVSAVNAIGETANSNQVQAIPGYVNYWKFDETGGSTANDSWNNGVGTLSSGATFSTGIIDNAVSLNGTGYVTLPQKLVSRLTDFSISTWIKLDRVDNWARVFDFGSGTNNFMFLTPRNGQNSRLRYVIKNGGGEQQINTSSSLTTGRWYHVAVTQSGTTAILYLDGIEVGRNTDMTLNPSSLGNTTQNWIGKSQFADPLFAGQVDDFKIYNTTLSASEVADMVSSYLPPATPKNLTIVVGNNQVALSWTAVRGGTGYKIKRATSMQGSFEVIATVTDTSYTDISAVNCEKYFYSVSAINSVGESADTSPWGPSLGSKLSGILIGTNGSLNNNPDRTKEAAVDGNLGTFFDAAQNTAWVGYDLGADGASVVTRIRYAPRADNPNRMIGGRFEGANTANFSDATTLFVVPSRPATAVLTEQFISSSKSYRYVRFFSPNGYGAIAELEFYGLIGQIPVFSSAKTVEGTYDSTFYYSTVASNMPEKFTATGLPEGLKMDTCTGIISGKPNATGTFTVAITAANYYKPAFDTVVMVIKKNQTISFASIPAKLIGDSDFELQAVASSGLPVTYSSSDSAVATIVNGNILHINAVGTSVITTSQVGDNIYYPASAVNQSFTVAPLNISVLYKDGDSGNITNNTIKPQLQVANNDGIGIPYSELTIRYWLTPENYAGINTWIDYAQLGVGMVYAKYVALENPHEGAFGYVEYRFDSKAGILKVGGKSGPIQSRISNTNQANFNESDDYSYQSGSSFVANNHVTIYRNGYLIGGTEPAEVDGKWSLKVFSENKNLSTGTTTIKTYLKLINDGNVPVSYNDLSVRYWFTKDSNADLTYWIDYADLNKSKVSGKFVTLDPVVSGADTYFEIAVDSTAGVFYPLSNSGEIQYRITKKDWSNFDETNDYSYLPKAPYAENDHITVYHKGKLVFGTEPGASSNTRTGTYEQQTEGAGRFGEFSLYPNPVSDKLTVILNTEYTENTQITLHHSSGKPMVAANFSGSRYELDLSKLPQGVYIVTLANNQGSVFRKIVKE